MKKYCLKVDSPWGKKGCLVTANTTFGPRIRTDEALGLRGFIAPEKYPEIFEEVIEQIDEEWLAKWCHDHWLIKWPDYPYVEYKNKNIEFKNQWERLANALIQHGFDVKKLRGES